MQVLKTILWALLLVVLVAFSVANWEPQVTVQIWEGIVLDTKIPALVIVSFLIGFVPMWLFHRGEKWRLKRRIAALENALGSKEKVLVLLRLFYDFRRDVNIHRR